MFHSFVYNIYGYPGKCICIYAFILVKKAWVFMEALIVMIEREMGWHEVQLLESYLSQLEALVAELGKSGVDDKRVLEALRKVPRHEFVQIQDVDWAYDNVVLGIGEDQTISQPLVVGLMSQLLELKGHERVLEVGTGSGYQAAVLSRLAAEVESVEIISNLARTARDRLFRLGYRNVTVIEGDGAKYKQKAPYDAIIVTAAAPSIPQPLIAQLAEGGRLVMPVGSRTAQELIVGRKVEGEFLPKRTNKVRFVPLTGEYGVTAEF